MCRLIIEAGEGQRRGGATQRREAEDARPRRRATARSIEDEVAKGEAGGRARGRERWDAEAEARRREAERARRRAERGRERKAYI